MVPSAASAGAETTAVPSAKLHKGAPAADSARRFPSDAPTYKVPPVPITGPDHPPLVNVATAFTSDATGALCGPVAVLRRSLVTFPPASGHAAPSRTPPRHEVFPSPTNPGAHSHTAADPLAVQMACAAHTAEPAHGSTS